jgi:hypothetical protein
MIDKTNCFLRLTVTQNSQNYLIIQFNNMEKLVILADTLEINSHVPSGTGVYNIGNSAYNADNTFMRDITVDN